MRLCRTLLASVVVLAVVVQAVVAQEDDPRGRAPDQRRDRRMGPPGERFGRPFGPPRLPVMTAIDADNDGEISAKELAQAVAALKKLDKDGDGKLSAEELRPQFGGPGGPDARGGRDARRGPRQFGGPGPMGAFGARQASSLQSTPQPKDDEEKKILQTLKDIQQEQGRRMNVPETDGRLLRLLAEAIGAKKVVEIGTSNGISAIWLGTALRKTGGKLITFEIDARTAEVARKNFARAGMADLVTVVEGNAHETVSQLEGPIDLVFIDADKQGYADYLKKLLPLVRPGGLILAHNINPRMADPAFIKAATTDPNLETLFYTQGAGMSVTLKKR